MIPDWTTNTVIITQQLRKRFPALAAGLDKILDRPGIELQVLEKTKDCWLRDFAPVQVAEKRFVQFRYFPDYLREGFQHLITPPEICADSSFFPGTVNCPLIVDGGNLVGTERIVVFTKKVFQENPDQSHEAIQQELTTSLMVTEVIPLPIEPGDDIGHADGMVRFLDDTTVVVNDYEATDPAFARAVDTPLKSAGLKLVRLPYVPDLRRTRKGEIPSAVGNYVNFLRVGSVVVLPTYEMPEDDKAFRTLQKCLPDCRIETLPCRDLAKEGGVLNCVTSTIRRVQR
jgi:agmatine deiminase